MLAFYRSIMDASANPLKDLPPAQRFQIMTLLGLMWTTIFCTGAGAWIWFGQLIVFHLLAGGLAVTGVTFEQVRLVKTYRDYPAEDGASRYDDVWGP